MNDDPNTHQPTPEFRASLEREIANALRRESRFTIESAGRARMYRVIGLAAGAVFTLTVGLVLGASTGYASAEEILRVRGDLPLPPSTGLAVLKKIPPLMFSCGEPPIRAAELPDRRQQPAVIDLPAATTKSVVNFGGILGLRETENGSLLVNDGGRHQVSLLDASLALRSVVRDSAPGTSTSYGTRPVPLMRYLGDSSIFADEQSGSLLVLGSTGQVLRTMAPSDPDMMLGLNLYFGAVDQHGRIVFGSQVRDMSRKKGGVTGAYSAPESTVVVRADLETRKSDTLARLRTFPSTMMVRSNGVTKFTVDPLPQVDEWAMASDGAIAIVRGRDYHIDWIHPDGTTHATPKLPYDWKRVTDEDKQRLIDSTRAAEEPVMSRLMGARRRPPADGGDGARSGARGYSPGAPVEQGPPAPVEYVPPALSEMPDYYPPIHQKSMLPDLDGNIWILPTASAQSKAGELVYDVVNVKGAFRRVRLPLGRSVVGFGRNGVVYLIAGDKTNGFTLEKTKITGLR